MPIDTSITPLHGLNFSGGYTYLDTKLKSFTPFLVPGYLPASSTSQVGSVLSMSPKHKLTLSGRYTLPLDDSIGAA